MSEGAAGIQVTVESDGEAWDAFVARHASATAYHTWAWRQVFGDVFGHEPLYLAAHASGNDRRLETIAPASSGGIRSTIVGVLPLVSIRSRLFGRFLCSLPFVNYGGMLLASGDDAMADGPALQEADGDPTTGRAVAGSCAAGSGAAAVSDSAAVAGALMARATALARERGARHVELRHIAPQLTGVPTRTHKVTMWLPLAGDVDAQWKALDNKVRNQVRKAEKSGLTARTGGAELLDDFYPVFAETMRDLGTPVYPRRFFDAVLRASGTAARVHVVSLDAQPLAAALTIDHPDGPRSTDHGLRHGRTEVPWAAARRQYRPLCPNMLLYWHMLRDTVARGVGVFDFGRSTPGEGTFHFKKQWKAEPHPLHWEYALLQGTTLPDQGPTNAKFQLAIEAWKRLPLAVANRLGPLVIGNIP